MTLTRRRLLAGSLGVFAAHVLSGCAGQRRDGVLLSAYEDVRGDQFVGGLRLEDVKVFGVKVPMRAHGCAVDPRNAQRVIYFARRPGTHAFELMLDGTQLRTAFETPAGRHLAGHGVFSADGAWLFTPEHDYEHARGVIAVRDARTFELVAELDSGGLDPHEVIWLGEQLGVANGGIMTHPRTYRRKLNIDTMDPSFCLLDARTGAIREQHRLQDHQLSIRHLSAIDADRVVAGLQYEGDHARTPGLVAMYVRGGGFKLLPMPRAEIQRSKSYVASVLADVSHDAVLASCPYGAGVARWSLSTGSFDGFVDVTEGYGLSRSADGDCFVSLRDGTALDVRSRKTIATQIQHVRWDDHWRWHEDAVTVRA